MRFGTIVAVCTSPSAGLPKYPQERAEVGSHGLIGDYHNREMRRSFSRPGTVKPNIDRHITVFAEEVLDDLNAELVLSLGPGAFGENLLVRGLGDLSDIKDGSLLEVDDPDIPLPNQCTLLRVVEQNKPCKNLQPYHRLMVKKVYGRRGLLCTIERRGLFVRPKYRVGVLEA